LKNEYEYLKPEEEQEMIGLVHLLALIAGVAAIFFIKKKYTRISAIEMALIIILYFALVLLFTEPVVNFVFNKMMS
jgi:hypothetical protein